MSYDLTAGAMQSITELRGCMDVQFSLSKPLLCSEGRGISDPGWRFLMLGKELDGYRSKDISPNKIGASEFRRQRWNIT